jgi:heterodisulfide reductase subunit C
MRVSPQLAGRTKRRAEFDASACLSCGVCVALCPLGYSILPRRLFHLMLLGLDDVLEEHRAEIYSCLLCRMCEANCPAGVHIAENVRHLRTVIGIRPRQRV